MGIAERMEPIVLGAAAKCLRLPPESIDPHAALSRYGLDSLTALELCVALGDATGVAIAEEELLDAPSIHALAQRLVEREAPPIAADDRIGRMLTDTRLAAEIDPRSVPAIASGPILLTGATGFLGVHLLAALAADATGTIVCPVRARNDRHARERIAATMDRYGVRIAGLDRRVVAIAADLNDPHFGCSSRAYRRLAHELGAVVHCAADVNWARPYAGLRAANVLLTLNLLRFAATGMRKRFHFISSLAACYSTRAPFPVAENDPGPEPAGIHLGYAQSKWVAERLVEACRDRGLEAMLYRPSLIIGDSASGVGNDDDLLAQLIRGVIALGHAPDVDWRLDACPVDYVARAIACVVRGPSEGLKAVHLRNPRPARWSEALLWMNLRGYRVHPQPFAAWIERAEQASRDPAHVLHRLRGFLMSRPEGGLGRTLPEIYADPNVAQVNAERSDALMARLGLQCPRIAAGTLERIFDTWIERKLLPNVMQSRPPARRAATLDDRQIETQLQAHFHDSSLRVTASRHCDFGLEHSILGELAAWHDGSALAMHARSIDALAGGARRMTLEIVVKPKYGDTTVLAVADQVAALCSPELGAAFAGHHAATGFGGSAQRELGVYARADCALRAMLPRCYGVIEDKAVRALLLERVGKRTAIDRADRSEGWSDAEIKTALDAIGRIHGEWLGRDRAVHALLGGTFTQEAAADAGPLWRALSAYAEPRLRAWIGAEGARAQAGLAAAAPRWLAAHISHPRTVAHNDFNPRNVVWREDGALCLFDWELAEFGLPQRDAIEMLCHVLPPDASLDRAQRCIEHHREAAQSAAGAALDAAQWADGVGLALADFGVRRLPMHVVADRFRPQPFLERVTRTWYRLLNYWGGTIGYS